MITWGQAELLIGSRVVFLEDGVRVAHGEIVQTRYVRGPGVVICWDLGADGSQMEPVSAGKIKKFNPKSRNGIYSVAERRRANKVEIDNLDKFSLTPVQQKVMALIRNFGKENEELEKELWELHRMLEDKANQQDDFRSALFTLANKL